VPRQLLKYTPYAEHDRVSGCNGGGEIARIGHMSAGMSNILNAGLHRPVLRKLHLVRQLDDCFVVADRHRGASDADYVAIKMRCLRRLVRLRQQITCCTAQVGGAGPIQDGPIEFVSSRVRQVHDANATHAADFFRFRREHTL
jgi:hypothetical protein